MIEAHSPDVRSQLSKNKGSGTGVCSRGPSLGGGEFGGKLSVGEVGTWGFGIGESIGEEGGGLRGEGVSGLGGVVGLREMWKKAEVEWV